MIKTSEVRVGIVIVEGCIAYRFVNDLMRKGCLESNITVKVVPNDLHLALGVLFMAEYTDVDCVIAVANGKSGHSGEIVKAVLDLQIQWNMPVEFVYNEDLTNNGTGVVQMVQLQSDMAGELPEERPMAPHRRDNVN